jgi:hypothetical protein
MKRKIIDFDYGLTISEPHLIKPDLIYQKRYGIQVKRMTLEETFAQLEDAGIDHVVIQPTMSKQPMGVKSLMNGLPNYAKNIRMFSFSGSQVQIPTKEWRLFENWSTL